MGLNRLQRLLGTIIVLGAVVLVAVASEPDDTESVAEIIGSAQGSFGASVAVSGEFAVVGRPQNTGDRGRSGSATIYEWTGEGWVQRAELHAPGRPSDRHLGIDVAIDGDVVAVGATNKTRTDGSVYLFERVDGDWVEVASLTTNRRWRTQFGQSVALSGDYLFVGAPADREAGKRAGAVFVFQRQQGVWQPTPVQKLMASDASGDADFGADVAIMGPDAVVGAPSDDHQSRSNRDYGAAYVFELENGEWREVAKLRANDPSRKGDFGLAVTLFGDEILIGAPGEGRAGAAYQFHYTGGSWSLVHKLTPSMGTHRDRFGTAVALADRFLLVGADESTLLQESHDHQGHGHDHHGLHHSHHYHRHGHARWRGHHGQPGHGHHGRGYPHWKHIGQGRHPGSRGHRRHHHPRDHQHDNRVPKAGAVYVYERAGADWSEVDILTPHQARRYAHFGYAIALSGDHVLIGAPAINRGRYGRVYAYRGFQSNAAPEILSAPVTVARVGGLYDYRVVAIDADDDPLEYLLTAGPSGMVLDASSGLLTWTPDTPGEVTVDLEVRDDQGGIVTQSYEIVVAPNHRPVITSTPLTSAVVGTVYTYSVEASDPDFDPLTYHLQIFPVGMLIDPNGVISWTPAATGDVMIQVVVSDGFGGHATQTFVIHVERPNQAPEIISVPLTQAERFYLVPEIRVTDDNLATQTITLNGNPYISGTEITSAGTYELTVEATDDAGNANTTTIQFTLETTPFP